MKKLIKSFMYAFDGLKSSFITERNMKIHVFFVILVTICGFIFKISSFEWIICILLFGLVISAELFNTAIETTVDLACSEKNKLAKLAKDISAGAVLILALASIIIGMIIFIPKI